MLGKKIKELRVGYNMTQSELAGRLGISSQSVSKWERGLLSPDISLLPQIANIFNCSIDNLFGRDSIPSTKRLKDFILRMEELRTKGNWEEEYNAWIKEIDTNPEEYLNYLCLMKRVYAEKDFSLNCLIKMEYLADIVDHHCTDINIKNGVNFAMVHICAESGKEWYIKKTESYYKRLPLVRDCRDRLIKYILSGDELIRSQMFNVSNFAQQLCESIIELGETADHDKMYYYKKAAEIYEVILDNKFGGRYEEELLNYYYQLVLLAIECEKRYEAEEYIDRILAILERHFDNASTEETIHLLYAVPKTLNEIIVFSKGLLISILEREELKIFHNKISDFKKRYFDHFAE